MPKSFIFYQLTKNIDYTLNIYRVLVRIQEHSKLVKSN